MKVEIVFSNEMEQVNFTPENEEERLALIKVLKSFDKYSEARFQEPLNQQPYERI